MNPQTCSQAKLMEMVFQLRLLLPRWPACIKLTRSSNVNMHPNPPQSSGGPLEMHITSVNNRFWSTYWRWAWHYIFLARSQELVALVGVKVTLEGPLPSRLNSRSMNETIGRNNLYPSQSFKMDDTMYLLYYSSREHMLFSRAYEIYYRSDPCVQHSDIVPQEWPQDIWRCQRDRYTC